MQFKGKLINQTWENTTKTNFRPDFGPNLSLQNFFHGFYLKSYIVLSYHFMQFPGKLMNQTWENGKKSKFGPNLGLLWPKFGLPNCFWWILLIGRHFLKPSSYEIYMLDIVSSYHYMQYQEKTMNQTWQNSEIPNLRPDFGMSNPNLGPPIFFSWVLPLLDVRHYYKLSL